MKDDPWNDNWARKRRREDRLAMLMVAGVVVGVFALLAVTIGFLTWNFDFKPAYQTVKPAVERLGCTASEDVIGKAADINASLIVWNWFGIGADYEVIEIPDCR